MARIHKKETPHQNPQVHKKGAIVLGGGIVEVDDKGKFFIMKGHVAEYLAELGRILGPVHFFVNPKYIVGRSFGFEPDERFVKVHILRHAAAGRLIVRLCAYLQDLSEIVGYCRHVVGVIEFHPAIGGLVGSVGLALTSTKYIVYFGIDTKERWNSVQPVGIKSITTFIKKYYLLFSAYIATMLADCVLVRDAAQLHRLEHSRPGHGKISKPISSLVNVISKRENSCENSTVKLLFVGMLLHRKGLIELLQALALMNKDPFLENRRLHLTIVGGSPSHKTTFGYTQLDLRNMAGEFDLGDSISLEGFVSDIEKLRLFYKDADIFVLPSKSEGFPRVIDEALAAGLPIVTTNLSGISEILIDGQTALLVQPGNANALAKAITRIITDSTLRQRLIQGAKELAYARFDETAAQQHARILSGDWC